MMESQGIFQIHPRNSFAARLERVVRIRAVAADGDDAGAVRFHVGKKPGQQRFNFRRARCKCDTARDPAPSGAAGSDRDTARPYGGRTAPYKCRKGSLSSRKLLSFLRISSAEKNVEKCRILSLFIPYLVISCQ